jgi:lysophospholipase L1-like esterase
MRFLIQCLALSTVFVAVAAASSRDAASAVPGEPVGLVRYVALGDSVTWQDAYVSSYAGHTAADLTTQVTTTNLGVPFWWSGTLLQALQENQTYRTAVAEADVITIFIGLNDYQWMHGQYRDASSIYCPPPKDACMPAMVAAFQSNWSQIINEIRALNPAPNLAIRALTIFNPYVAQDQAAGDFAYFDGFLSQMNATIVQTPGVSVGDLHDAFNGPSGDGDVSATGYFSTPDPLHPNGAGHEVMADVLRGTGYPELDADGDHMLDVEFDSDGDGCADIEEAGSIVVLGGRRDPDNSADFYDVNGTQNVDAADIGLVRSHFNASGPVAPEDAVYDRSPGEAVWAPGPANNRINAIDVALVRASYGHRCDQPS